VEFVEVSHLLLDMADVKRVKPLRLNKWQMCRLNIKIGGGNMSPSMRDIFTATKNLLEAVFEEVDEHEQRIRQPGSTHGFIMASNIILFQCRSLLDTYIEVAMPNATNLDGILVCLEIGSAVDASYRDADFSTFEAWYRGFLHL
jgi:hypothetical protein